MSDKHRKPYKVVADLIIDADGNHIELEHLAEFVDEVNRIAALEEQLAAVTAELERYKRAISGMLMRRCVACEIRDHRNGLCTTEQCFEYHLDRAKEPK